MEKLETTEEKRNDSDKETLSKQLEKVNNSRREYEVELLSTKTKAKKQSDDSKADQEQALQTVQQLTENFAKSVENINCNKIVVDFKITSNMNKKDGKDDEKDKQVEKNNNNNNDNNNNSSGSSSIDKILGDIDKVIVNNICEMSIIGANLNLLMNSNTVEWKISITNGINKNISNNGLKFTANENSDEYIFGRSDQGMKKNSGIYEIKFKIDEKGGSKSTVGLCTDYYNSKTEKSAIGWNESKYYIGWCIGYERNEDKVPNGVMAGYNKLKGNIFFENGYKFEGDEQLPPVKENDIVLLVYDSDKNTLSFGLNGRKLNCKITNLYCDDDLYWFFGRRGSPLQLTVVN